MNNKKVIILGGAGYIGSVLAEQLVEQGYDVTVFDICYFGKTSLQHIQDKITLIKADIRDEKTLISAFKDAYCVIHLAGLVGDPACSIDETTTREINIDSTKPVINAAKKNNVPHFIYISSCSVYGSVLEKVDEESKLNPVSLYARSKIEAENMLKDAASGNFKVAVLRLSTVYGHSYRQRFDLVANLFTAQAYFKGIITVTGGAQYRPFVHVQDVSRAIQSVMKSGFGQNFTIYNVGSDNHNFTIGEIAEHIKDIVQQNKEGQPVQVVLEEYISDKRNYSVSFEKISSQLGFQPAVTFAEGINELLQHIKKGRYDDYIDDRYSNVATVKNLLSLQP